MQITLDITGRSPLLHHNIQLSDPDFPIVRQIKALTDKRKRTEQDRREIERLEWFGGLILAPNGDGANHPAWKSAAIRKCLIESGTISREGKTVARALAFRDVYVPLVYDGPGKIEKLWENESFRNRASIGIGMKRTMRMRPQFMPWALSISGILLEDVIDIDTFTRIVERAGLAIGMGDNRVNGYGRFDAKVVAR